MSSFVPVENVSSRLQQPEYSPSDTTYRSGGEDSLLKHTKTSPSDRPFKISELKSRNSIPPPNERDIVRKSTQGSISGSVRVDSPLGPRTLNEIKTYAPVQSLKVNSTGLPRPPSQSGGLPRSAVR